MPYEQCAGTIKKNRILVRGGIYNAFPKRPGAMKVADGFEPGAVIGPLIDIKAVEKVQAHIAAKTVGVRNTRRHCEFLTGQGGRPAVNETATKALSWRKPGSTDPPAERWKGGPRLLPGQRLPLSYSWAILFLVRGAATKQSGSVRARRLGIASLRSQ